MVGTGEVGVILGGVALLWWCSILLECLREEHADQRTIWVIVLLAGNALGALAYVVLRRPQRLRESANPVPPDRSVEAHIID